MQAASDARDLSPARAGALTLAAAALLLLPGLGAVDLWAPDEPRYGAIAEEMRDGDAPGWLLLHLAGQPYAHKPPLYFWLAALAGAPGGRVSETAARLPSAAAGVAAVALCFALGRRLFGARTGAVSGLLLLTAAEFAHRARRAQLDVLLTLFELTALFAFWELLRGAPARRRNLALLHGALGLAVLTKGPVGWLVPALAMAATLAWERRLRELPRLFPPWALLLSVGPGLAWLAAASALAPPGWLSQATGENLIGRFFAGTSHDRPFYYYAYQFPLNFLPWTLLLPAVARAGATRVFAPGADAARARAWRFLLAWLGATLAFFTLSAGKRGLYLLPAFPAAALLCADAALGGGRGVPRWLRGGIAAAWLLEVGLFLGAFPALDAEKSPRPIATAAREAAGPGRPVGLFSKRSLAGALTYYGAQPVVVLEEPGDVAAFLAGGGRIIVVPAADLPALRERAAVEVLARERRGERALLVVSARAP